MIFLSKHISLYALGRIRWILDIIWPLHQNFKLKNQRNWLKQVWALKFWSVINCFFMHWPKKLTLVFFFQGSLSLHTAVITRLLLSKIEPDCASGFRKNRQKSWKQDGHYFWRPSMDLQRFRRIQQPGCKLLPPSWLQTWPVYSTVYGEQVQYIY